MICSPQFSGGNIRPLFCGVAVCAFLTISRVSAGVLDDSVGGAAKPTSPASSASASTPNSLQPKPLDSASQPSASQPGTPSQPKTDPVDTNNPYDRLAKDLASASVSGEKVSVGIGKFLDGDGDTASPYSARLREELAVALPKTGKFEVITRDRLADLQDEEKFQSSDIASPGSDASKVQVRTIHGIIRGRIYAKPEELEVFAHIAHLNGGEIHEIKVAIPLKEKVVIHEQSIDPIQWLVENKRERPTEVTLIKEVAIPLVSEGKSVGSMMKPSGTVIHVDDLTAAEIKTQICGVSLTIPNENTNLAELAKGKLKLALQEANDQKTANAILSNASLPSNKNSKDEPKKAVNVPSASIFSNTKWMKSNKSICFSADGALFQWETWKRKHKNIQSMKQTSWVPVDQNTVREIDGDKRQFTREPDGLKIRQANGDVWTIYN